MDSVITVYPIKKIYARAVLFFVINSNIFLYKILKNADFITIHIPLERGQGYLIGTKEFNMMKDRVYFINHARGGLVCEKA